MKSFNALNLALLFLFKNIIAMDNSQICLSIDNKQWRLSKTISFSEKPLSSYFDKLSRLIIATTNSITLASNKTTILRRDSICSAYSIHNGQFIADCQKQKGNTLFFILLDNPFYKPKFDEKGIAIEPSSEKSRSNYLIFGSDCPIAPMQFDSEEKYFAIANKNKIGICKILPNDDGTREYAAIFDTQSAVTFLCFHPVENIIAAATSLPTARINIYDVNTKQALFSLPCNKNLQALCFNKDSYLAAIKDDEISIIDIKQQQVIKSLKPEASSFYTACFHPTQNLIAAAYKNGTLQIINIDNLSKSNLINHDVIDVPLHCFSKNDNMMVIIDKGKVHIMKMVH